MLGISMNSGSMNKIKKLFLKNEFALKPRRLRNTFWLWGLLYPSLLALGLGALTANMFPGEGEYIVGYGYEEIPIGFFVGLYTSFIFISIEVLFAIYLSFKAMSNRPKIRKYIICILQFFLSIQLVITWLTTFYLDYVGFD